jgi:acyl-CoA synthetase (AMP-forming)/AMP-acid ligase II
MPLALLRECIEVFGCGFVQMYGMTETAGAIVALPPEDHETESGARLASVGQPLPGVELRILDPAGQPLPAGEIGEIATRSLANMTGYYNLPQATAATIDGEGWLHTGDAGYLDADGYLFLKDRIKDLIISGGENVYPAEVEIAICDHPDVAEVAVIGVPDAKWGESVKAIVVAKPGANPEAASIIAWARARIAAYKTPRYVEFVAALPRNASGKILRRELREHHSKLE